MSCDRRPNSWDDSPRVDEEKRDRLDEFMSALSSQRRRDLLYLIESSEVTDVDTLTKQVAALETGALVSELSSEICEQMQMEIIHSHLPKLAEVSAIEYDRRTNVVRFRGYPSMLESLIEICREIEVD